MNRLTFKTVEKIKLELEEMAKVINAPQAYLPTYHWSEGSGRPHIEVRDDGYHFVVSERGHESQRKVTQDLDDILYWSISGATFSVAGQYELNHRIPDQDFRRLLFQKDLELLEKVNKEFAFKRKTEIDQILEKQPYNDLIEHQLHVTSTTNPIDLPYSNVQPIWHLIVLTIITTGFYQMVWFYKSWKQLQKHNNWELSYVYRTVFTFIPIIGCIIAVDLFNRIKRLLKQSDIKVKIYPITMMLGFYIFNTLYRLPHLYWLIGFLSIVPLAYAQHALNLYWEQEQPDHNVRDKFTKRQWVLIVIGSLYWILIIIGLFV